jgi:hypothetical protein
MARRKKGFGNLVADILFGEQVGDDEEARKSPTWRYQKRQNKLLVHLSLLWVGFAAFCIWEAATESTRAGITVSFVFLVFLMFRAVAAALDAIFDSLFERINLQSAWLETRLTMIESNTAKDGKLRAQQLWQSAGLDESDYYYTCPERSKNTETPE